MWIQRVRELPLLTVAEMGGFSIGRGRSFYPCPACTEERRGSSDKRGPCGTGRDNIGWKCHRCGAKGDAVDLVSFKIHGRRFREASEEQRRAVYTWFLEHDFLSGDWSETQHLHSRVEVDRTDRPRLRPPRHEVADLWAASLSPGLVESRPEDVQVAEFFERRTFPPLLLERTGIVRILPRPSEYTWPSWWPRSWSPYWRVAVPAFEPNGRLASIHARAVTPDTKPKTRWPYGFEAGGLLLANREGVHLMRGRLDEGVGKLVICEGLTDLLRLSVAAVDTDSPIAVLSGTSGSFSVLGRVEVPEKVKVFVATDPDETGEEYAWQIAKALSDRPVYRVPLQAAETM